MAAIANFPHIDPSKPAKFHVTISEQLLREEGPRKRRKVNIQRTLYPQLMSDEADWMYS